MAAFREARRVYETEVCGRTFEDDLLFYLECGIVINRPDLFVMARPVISTAGKRLILGQHVFNSAQCDAWFIALLAGNMVRAMAFMPWDLPYVCYQRKNGDLSVYKTEQLKQRLGL